VALPLGPELTASHSVWLQVEAGKSSTFSEVGRLEERRRHFEATMANDLEDLPRDYAELWIPVSASAGGPKCCGRDNARATRLGTTNGEVAPRMPLANSDFTHRTRRIAALAHS